MAKENERIVWLIDDNEDELTNYAALLQSELPKSIVVQGTSARPKIGDYADLVKDEATSAVIVDQRLKTAGIANYTGIELAQYLRVLNQKVPIYILTNFADEVDEFTEGEWSVEYIISKSDVVRDDKRRVFAARLTRHIDIYAAILQGRAERFDLLLRKGLEEDLSKAELDELEQLKFERSTPALANELAQLTALREVIQEHEELMASIRTKDESDQE